MKKSLFLAGLAVISSTVLGMNPFEKKNQSGNNLRHMLTPDSSPRSNSETNRSLEEDNRQLWGRIFELEQHIISLEEQNKQNAQLIFEKDSEISGLHRRNQQLMSSVVNLRNQARLQITEKNAKISRLSSRISQFQSANQQLVSNNEALNELNSQLAFTKCVLNQQISNLQLQNRLLLLNNQNLNNRPLTGARQMTNNGISKISREGGVHINKFAAQMDPFLLRKRPASKEVLSFQVPAHRRRIDPEAASTSTSHLQQPANHQAKNTVNLQNDVEQIYQNLVDRITQNHYSTTPSDGGNTSSAKGKDKEDSRQDRGVNAVREMTWEEAKQEQPEGAVNITNRALYIGNSQDLSLIKKDFSFPNLEILFCRNLEKVPPEIGNLTNLKELKLSCCESLEELPPEIGKLTNLKRLYLNHSKSLKELPPEIGNLTNLEKLFRGGCRNLKKLPLEIGNLIDRKSLVVNILDLSNKDLEGLPALMIRFQKLKEIDLRGNPKINSIDKIHDAVFGLPLLETLWMTENGQDKKYGKNEIAKIREERIKSLDERIKRLHLVITEAPVNYLNAYKNKISLSKEEIQKLQKDSRRLENKLSFLKSLLAKLKAAKEKINASKSGSSD